MTFNNSRKIVTGLLVLGLVGLAIYWLSPKPRWFSDSSEWKRVHIKEVGLSVLFPTVPQVQTTQHGVENVEYDNVNYTSHDNEKNLYTVDLSTYQSDEIGEERHDDALNGAVQGYVSTLEGGKLLFFRRLDFKGYSAIEAEVISKVFYSKSLFLIFSPKQLIQIHVMSPTQSQFDPKLYDKFIDSIVFDQ